MLQDVLYTRIKAYIQQTDVTVQRWRGSVNQYYFLYIRMDKCMSGVNLPHDHGQNIEKVLERMPNVDECAIVAEVFKQISDGSRIRILWLLCHCEECVSNIAAAMNMSDPAVSHHLKLLKKSGLIVSRRDGKEIYYKLADTQTANLLHHIIEEMFRITCPLD